MNWFERHLNWTLLIATIALPLISLIIGYLVGDSLGTYFPKIIGLSVTILALLVYGWVLKKKKRSLWWLLLFWWPIGCIVYIELANKSVESGANQLLNSNDAAVYITHGCSHISKGDYDKAILDFTKAIEIDPQAQLAYFNRGFAFYADKAEYDKAISDFTKAIEIDPQAAPPYSLRGVIYLDQRDYDKAIADLTRAIEIDPQSASAYTIRSRAYEQKGEKSKSEADFQKAKYLGII